MYRIDKNNYHSKPKNSTIYTPKEVSQFLFNLLSSHFPDKTRTIFDPCAGTGSLLEPWQSAGYQVLGIDIAATKPGSFHIQSNFLDLPENLINWEEKTPALILCNPPFNGYGKQLGSEVWLDKIIELFGKEVPIVLFTPIGFRLNLTLNSKRHQKLVNGIYPQISSQITLPKNIFAGVIFHSEILIFNLPNLQPHYFFNHHEI